jgi:hypothetical protein
LDDDKEGAKAAARYKEEWLLPDAQIATIGALSGKLRGKSLEGALSSAAKTFIGGSKSRLPSKKEIGRFFQERYAKEQMVEFDDETTALVKEILDNCGKRLASRK